MTFVTRRNGWRGRVVAQAEDHPVFVDVVVSDLQGGKFQAELLESSGVIETPCGFLLGGDG